MVVSPSAIADVSKFNFEGRQCRLRETTFQLLTISGTLPVSALADITAKAVTVGGLVASNKVYDGITTATVDLSGVTFSGIVSGDTLTASDTTGTFGNKNVGTDKTVTLAGTTYGGTDSANYSFTDQASALADISAKSVTVSGIAAGNRVYDGTTVAAVDHSGVVFNGMVSGDSLTASDTTGSFSNKNVGNAKAVTLSGTTYGGTDVGNYSLTDQTSTTANITAKPITVSGVRAVDRVYDGTLIARINRHGVTFNGIVSGDDLTASDTTGTYADKNVGTDKTVTLAGTTYGGTDLSNYSITDQASAVADITPKSVTVGGLVANDKVYDGTRVATVDHSGVTFDGIIAGDELTAAETTGTFAVKDVFYYDEFGDDKDNRVVLNDTTYGGADVGNYTFGDQSASVAAITPKPLTISGLTADDKVYDGTTTATFDSSGVVYDGLVDGDDVALAVSGNDVDNYSTSYTEAVTADIFRLDSVTWVGGLTGDWSDPANWAGGAIPDFANVANVIIPTAATPTFDGSVPGPVEIDSVTGGNLQIDSGTLNVANDVALDNYIQNGGAFHVGNDFNVSDFVQHDGELTIGNDFQVTNSFYQSLLSTITVTADTDVYHTTGDLTVANLSSDNITLKSTNGGVSLGDVNALGTLTVLACDGDIDQLEETAVAVEGDATFEATGDITLTDKSNNFTGTVNACGAAVNIDDADNRLQFGVFKAADKDEALMDIVSSAVRDTNTRYLIDETSTDTGSPAVSQRFGQGPQTGATNGLDGSSESAPVLTEQNIQDVEGEVQILDGEPSKLSQCPGETVIQ